MPDDTGESSQEVELETYTVTSKGALIFYFRQRAQENLTIATHLTWLKRVNF